jgi:NAD(P)H dehydrogenase (quinone)
MGKIVITGASGQYGRGVTDRLIAAGLGYRLVLISRTPPNWRARSAGLHHPLWRFRPARNAG